MANGSGFSLPGDAKQELQRVLFSCLEEIKATQGALLLLDKFEQKLVLFASFGLNKQAKDGFPLPVGEPLAGKVAAVGRSLMLSFPAPESAARAIFQRLGIHSYLAAPLAVEGEVVGVLELRNKAGNRPFEAPDHAALERLARQAAEALRRIAPQPTSGIGAAFGKFVHGLHQISSERELLTLLAGIVFEAVNIEALGLVLGNEAAGRIFLVTESAAAPGFVQAAQQKLVESYREASDYAVPERGFDIVHFRHQERGAFPLTGVVQQVFSVPLRLEDGSTGCFQLLRNRTEDFGATERRTAVTIAGIIVTLLDHLTVSRRIHKSYLSTVKALLASAEETVPEIRRHSFLTAKYAKALGRRLELKEPEIEAMTVAALLHDIGLRRVKPYLLTKAKITKAEYEILKSHPTEGVEILSAIEFPYPVLPMIKHHHERWDGGGYPAGLKSEAIPLGARILSIAEAYSTMILPLPYQAAKSAEEARQELIRGMGTQFDPALVQEFLLVLDTEARGLGEAE